MGRWRSYVPPVIISTSSAMFTSRLKCLHLHAAHALVSENPIGKIVLDLLDHRACPAEDVICSGFESEDPPVISVLR